MNGDALLWVSLASVLVSCLAATAARALRDFSRHDLQEICQRRQKLDRFGDIIRGHDSVALGVEMLLLVTVTLAATAGGLWAWHRFALHEVPWPDVLWPKLVGIVAVTALLLAALVVCLPWSLARVGAEWFIYHTWPLWRLTSSLVYPLAWCARAVDTLLHRLAGREPQNPDEDTIEEEIRTIVTEGHREGLLEEDAREMIEGVIELSDVEVSHVMTPRTEMHMVNVHWPWEQVLEYVIQVGHTRIPVFDKNRDDIIGMLNSKDLLPELAKDADEPRRPLTELLRKPLFVPEAKAVDDLLELFQQTRTHIAIVLDEYGGVSGLVTIEDVLEEIVGEIEDEYDPEVEEEIRRIDDDVCEALGRAHVEEINELMSFELPEDEDFDTIGGFVFTEFGRVPLTGESITWRDEVSVTVLEATRRRVSRVRLERLRTESREIA